MFKSKPTKSIPSDVRAGSAQVQRSTQRGTVVKPSGPKPLQVGDPFIPYKRFTGIFIPEQIARCTWLSAGEKLAWGRLARYAGADGNCWPSVNALAGEIGVKARQARKYLKSLKEHNLIRSVSRFKRRQQTSNAYEFLWHPIYVSGPTDSSPEEANNGTSLGMNDSTDPGVNDGAHKESQVKEIYFKSKVDSEFNPLLRKNREARDSSPHCAEYPELRNALSDYMTMPGEPKRPLPKDRLVVDVMNAAAGATEAEVIRCLHYLRNERGLVPESFYGPRSYNWFITVVGDHFNQERARKAVYRPAPATDVGALTQDEMNEMTEAIECGFDSFK